MDDSSVLYRHFDAHGRLLYVGVAVNPKKRLSEHASAGANWVCVVAKSTYKRFRTHKEVLAAEIEAIKKESPLWNIAHSDAGNLRLTSFRVAASKGPGPSFSEPLEPCFVRCGVLISFRTHGHVGTLGCRRRNDNEAKRNYPAVFAWMEWFNFHYEDGCVTNADNSFCATWSDVIDLLDGNWYHEFVVRPQLGLESDFSKLKRPLWKQQNSR